jgi:ubiquinone/menaquinone biosynthesis C-methylase UbiE
MQPLYDSIGSTYGATRRADPAIAQELARLVGCGSNSRFLDVACGTGNYTCALAATGGEWHGTDISEVMLKQAVEKNSNIEWTVGSVERLPYQDRFFDGAVCSLAIHHFAELDTPFREVWRVLNKGRFVIFTAFPEQMQSYWLCHYFPEMMRRSSEKMPSKQSVVASLDLAGFEIVSVNPFFVTNQLQDLFLYSGKERPEFYLDPAIRENISSFASLCTAEELEHGLLALRADIASKRFDEVSQRYQSRSGDYAYVVATKGANGGD